MIVLEHAADCVNFTELAQILDYQAPDYYRYVDEYQHQGGGVGQCYRITGACELYAVDNYDFVDVWWTRAPPEITGVRWNNKTTLTWNPYDRGQRGEVASTITYEILQGQLGNWGGGTLSSQQWSEGTKYVGAVPPSGMWFLVRVVNACGGGSMASARGGA